jgi:hypothetical protein
MSGQSTTISQLQAAGSDHGAGVKVEVQWSTNDGVIVPATNSVNPAPAVNQVPGSLANNDPPANVRARETPAFFARYAAVGATCPPSQGVPQSGPRFTVGRPEVRLAVTVEDRDQLGGPSMARKPWASS